MKKKTTTYQFKNATFDFMWDVDIKPKKHSISSVYENYQTDEEEVSPEILELMNYDDFIEKLYEFVKNYNEKYKTLKMKKDHQYFSELFQKLESPMTIALEVKNGVGYVGWFPLLDEHKYEKNMWGSFRIKKVDMLNFLNSYSKKKKFYYNTTKSFEFSWCLDEIEEIFEDENTDDDCETILKKLMKTKQIAKGERCKGVVSWDESKSPIIYKVDYTYCSELGEDWDDDVWVKDIVKIKLK